MPLQVKVGHLQSTTSQFQKGPQHRVPAGQSGPPAVKHKSIPKGPQRKTACKGTADLHAAPKKGRK